MYGKDSQNFHLYCKVYFHGGRLVTTIISQLHRSVPHAVLALADRALNRDISISFSCAGVLSNSREIALCDKGIYSTIQLCSSSKQ